MKMKGKKHTMEESKKKRKKRKQKEEEKNTEHNCLEKTRLG